MSLARVVFAVLLAVTSARASAQTQPRVEELSPQGAAKDVRQVRARFSTPMVAFGDPRASGAPFAISCGAQGTGRWVDERNWVLDFAQDLPAGLRCQLRLIAGLRDAEGRAVGGKRRFAFSTGGPAIRRVFPTGKVVEDQVFVLSVDADPTAESLASHAYFATTGTRDRIGLEVVPSPERDALLKQFRWVVQAPRVPLVVRGRQRFAPDSLVTLVWGPGIATQSGVATPEAQRFEFRVRPPFRATLRCTRAKPDRDCVPLEGVCVDLSAPALAREASRILLTPIEPSGGAARAPELPEGHPLDEGIETVCFPGPFAPGSKVRISVPPELTDDAGRPLANAATFPMDVRLGDYPALAHFAARFGIVERSPGEAALPVTLRRVEAPLRARTALRSVRADGADAREILRWLRTVESADPNQSMFSSGDSAVLREIPRIAGSEPLEVVGIPLAEPGLHMVEIESELLADDQGSPTRPLYAHAAALVTNLAVHLKWGRESSLVWVTTLDEAKPVSGASVAVFDCTGNRLASGVTDADGIARLPDLSDASHVPDSSACRVGRGYSQYDSGILAIASLGDDVSFTHSRWQQGIEPWRFGVPVEWQPSPVTLHTVFDRALYRAGETAHMKHFARELVQAGFAVPKAGGLGSKLRIEHSGSQDRFDVDVTWDAAGSAESDWAIPRGAKLGTYFTSFVDPADSRRMRYSGSFQVEEFRVPSMRAQIRVAGEPLVTPKSVTADVSVRYLAGGGASEMPVRVRSTVRPRRVPSPAGFDDFEFGGEALREGPEKSWAEMRSEEEKEPVRAQDLKLDASGAARADVTDLPAVDRPLSLALELEYRDANGETRTSGSDAPLWPSERQVGLRAPRLGSAGESTALDAVVLDLAGKPRWRAPVRVTAYERRVFSYRERMIGGFYSWKSRAEVHRLGEVCSGRTDWGGRFRCEARLPAKGMVLLDAVSMDSSGRETHANANVFVPGADDWWFEPSNSDRMDVLPDQGRYEPGDTARLEVRMPFREATALVTVEREGVGESFVTRLSGKSPIVKIPIRRSHSPNVFVSVLALRGRAGELKPTATVDLGRPSARLGIAELRVGRAAHELQVRVEPERDTYTVRERARARVAVTRADGEALPAGAEIAVAVVDDALLQLRPNTSWDLLEAMMGRRGYGVETSTGQLQVIGRRHFGLKALPTGGGGGTLPTRELFDTLLLWQARVPLDADGRATVEFPLNDSLSRFRIEAIASAGADLFGSGSALVRTTQDLMLFSGLAPLVREGDRMRAEFTVRNASGRSLDTRVQARVSGLAESLPPLEVALAAGESRDVGWDVSVPSGAESLGWDVEAVATDGYSDRVRVVEKVAPAVPERVVQGTLAQVAGTLRLPVARPASALPGRGGLRIALQDSLVAAADGIAEWLREYPYDCLEQRVSTVVGRGDAEAWRKLVEELPAYLDADGLLKFFPSMKEGSTSLTAHVFALSQEAGFELPADVERRGADALARFVRGQLERESLALAPDLVPRKLQALAALARRGAATADLAGSIDVGPELWPTSSVIDWLEFARRVPDLPDRARQIERAESVLATRLHFEGTEMSFSWRGYDDLDWLLVDSDTNAARFVLWSLESKRFAADVARITRGAVQRMSRGAFATTTANAWGRLALARFARLQEPTPVSGSTRIALGSESHEVAWTGAHEPPASVSVGWPDGPGTLELEQRGSGKPWAFVSSSAAIPLTEPVAAGYHISKRLEPVVQKTPGVWSRGDVVRVQIEIDAQADKGWVVVDDPVPAGAVILDGGLAGSDSLAARPRPRGDGDEPWLAWPTYTERSFGGLRRYYEWVWKGRMRVQYAYRLNQSGRFQLPPTHVEALYAPGMRGDLPNAPFEVVP